MSVGDRIDRVRREMSLSERILSYIPGYRGYKEKEVRRESDRLVRMEVVARLREAKGILKRSLSNPAIAARISGEDSWRIDTLIYRLDRVTQRIDRAVAGYAGIFDAVKVREDKLESVIEYDLGLIEKAESVRSGIRSLASSDPMSGEWRGILDNLISRIDELDSLIDRRSDILRGVVG
ncbi:MAG: hypothetical protein RMJ00_04125 [Nitrososphaerota archaeon]|nr:hypothetical protein [Candidatus Bathyarchaeota archaeon]MCX8162478.1 hypothetical protein [Candidatus Bathyarchaeota archaeon]MDW8061866.1 hypothetical protein [Nitrososphaerota archaeon]